MATLSSLNARLERLEAVLSPEPLIVRIRTFPSEMELVGIMSNTIPYTRRKAGESDDALWKRATAAVEKVGGYVLLIEDRPGNGQSEMWKGRKLGSAGA